MFALMLALTLAQTSPAAPAEAAQAPVPTQAQAAQGWNVAATPQVCAVHTAFRSGTVLSVFALQGQEGIAFLIQNPSWQTLEDGAVYRLNIRFDEGEAWPVEAIARLEIDEDGPGLLFAVKPDDLRSGRSFLDRFASARGMRISNGETRVDTLALTGNHGATVALAQCLSQLWDGGAGLHEASERPFADVSDAPGVRI
ncbi:MAG: hypothetical protein ACK4K7_08990 [Allosphingosinicella sp.]|uniref:hypothetical protein n=1 Tax=Allosphingosinicella sp. TaxID=2823234 RepID=UPI00393D6464